MQSKDVAPVVKRGWWWIALGEDKEVLDEGQHKEEIPLMGMEGKPLASVGLSVTVGRSKKFAEKKLEIGAWCTMPCLPDPASMEEAYEICAAYVAEQADVRFNENFARFFSDEE